MRSVGRIIHAIAVLLRNDQPHALESVQLGLNRLLGERHQGNELGSVQTPLAQAEENAQQLGTHGRANEVSEEVHF